MEPRQNREQDNGKAESKIMTTLRELQHQRRGGKDMWITDNRQSVRTRCRCFFLIYGRRIWLAAGIAGTLVILYGIVGTYAGGLYTPVFYLTKSMVTFIAETGSFDSVNEYIHENAIVNNLTSSLIGVSNVIRGAAASLAVILWFPSLLQAAVNHQAYDELIVKRFIALGAALILIANSTNICTGIADIGVSLMGDITGSVTTSPVDALVNSLERSLERIASGEDTSMDDEYEEEEEEEIEVTEDSSLIARVLKGIGDKANSLVKKITNQLKALSQALGFFMALCVPWLIAAIARVIIAIACYMRSVEICILTVLSPIPFAMMSNEPLGSGPGARFLKNLAALSIQGAVMMVIAIACSALMTNKLWTFVNVGADFGELMTAGVETSAVAMCEAALLIKSLTLAQKAMGLQ